MAKDTTGRMRVQVKSAGRMKLSSKLWLERQLNDPYVQQAKKDGLRSRAAYKIIEMDDKHRFLRSGVSVVDLGAAPGGWSQVAARRVGSSDGRGQVIAIDLLEMPEIDHGDARPQEAVLVVHLDDLVGRARAQAVFLGLLHIGIVELPLEPELRRQLHAAGALDLDAHASGGVFCHC